AAGALLSTEDQEGEEQPEVSEPIESGSEWIPEIVEEIGEQPELEVEQEAPVAEIETELSEPFEGQIEPEVPEAMTEDLEKTPEELQPEPYGEQIAESAVTASEIKPEEIPDWLSGLAEEEEVEVEPTPTEWTPAMLVEEESAAEEIQESTVAKIDLNAASLSQLEKIPGIGFIHAQRILEYRQQVGSFKSLEELEKVHGLTTDMVNELENYLTVEVVVEEPAPISSHPDLQNAWTKINEGDIEDAVKQYTDLINRNEHLDEVIRDLQEALVKHPQEAYLYQTLGDAYMHSNMLDEALDAYNRAEDLIQ
ncbi:MAG: helix-hairpin-helix domain-containing protein, partial [Anaerolineales bacterium]